MSEVVSKGYFYKDGFFGYGEVGNFKYFSLAHIIPILVLCFSIFFIYKYRNKIKNLKCEENIRFILGFLMIINEMSFFWRVLYAGTEGDSTNFLIRIPCQICPWMCILGAFMLMKKSKKLYGLCYFIVLSLGLIPLFTPAVISKCGPGYFRYYQFWLEHFYPIIAVLYMTFVHNYKVKYKDIIKPIIFLVILGIFSLILNPLIEDGNFLYLKTTNNFTIANIIPIKSLFFRSLIYLLIAFIGYNLTYIPIYIKNKKEKKHS